MEWGVFWSVFVVVFIAIPLFFIWAFAIVDLFSRPDLGGLGKVMWLLGIIFFPVIGTIAYYLSRPAYPVARGSYGEEPVPGSYAPDTRRPAGGTPR